MIHENIQDMQRALASAGVAFENGSVRVTDENAVRSSGIDHLIWTAVFAGDEATKHEARSAIHAVARQLGAVSASILPLYMAIGRGEVPQKFTVPAHNIRTLTYDTCRRLFRAAKKHNVGTFIFEIARSEIGYTGQRPAEYAACVLAAAVKEGFRGPVFIQGDHFQASAKRWFGDEREKERKALEALIDEAIAAEFYNIDIDTSTLVDLKYPTLDEQQKENYAGTAHLTRYIRERQPKGIEISIGGEIGEVGKHNTSPEEFRAYMDGFYRDIPDGMTGISKVSIQTGTSHGGVVLPDGSIAKVSIDFETLRKISDVARSEYKIGGSVQHGASTLPEEVFDEFPKADAVEIHLATAFQNMVYDHPKFPKEFRGAIADWCRTSSGEVKKGDETEEQFIYKSRKKALGPFKQKIWELPAEAKNPILDDLEAKFGFLFQKLGVVDTVEVVNKHVKVSGERPEVKAGQNLQPLSALVVEGEGE